jgi:RNA methyltransferase, TrmH family
MGIKCSTLPFLPQAQYNRVMQSDSRVYSIKELSKLEKKHFRDEEGVFIVEGKKVLSEVKASELPIIQILATNSFLREHASFLAEQGINSRDITVIADHNAQRLTDSKTPQGVFAVVKKPETTLEDIKKHNFVVAFENVRDPGNLGTMLRTADWFGVTGVIVSDTGVDPYNSKVIRSTMGSLFHLDIYSSSDVASDLGELKKEVGFQIVVTRPEGSAAQKPDLARKTCVVMGNESTGTSSEVDQLADATYTIPKFGKAESLNVSVSFGIVLNDLTLKK